MMQVRSIKSSALWVDSVLTPPAVNANVAPTRLTLTLSVPLLPITVRHSKILRTVRLTPPEHILPHLCFELQ